MDLSDRALIDAGLALLRADTALVVWPDPEGVVPATPEPPYVMVLAYVERPRDDRAALDGRSTAATARWYIHAAGGTEPAAIAVAARARAVLLDVRPSVAGWSTGQIWQEAAQPVTRDESTGVPVHDLVTVYRLDATSV